MLKPVRVRFMMRFSLLSGIHDRIMSEPGFARLQDFQDWVIDVANVIFVSIHIYLLILSIL